MLEFLGLKYVIIELVVPNLSKSNKKNFTRFEYNYIDF